MSYKLLGKLESLLENYTVKEIVDGLGKICEDNVDKYNRLAEHDADYYEQAAIWRQARNILVPGYTWECNQ